MSAKIQPSILSRSGCGPNALRRENSAVGSLTGTGVTVSSYESAFTLVELLVVIAVIAILGALLTPALARAKCKARQVECINRMRQWTMAFKLYTDDNNGSLPREGYHSYGDTFLNNWGQVYSTQSADVWYNALPPYLHRRTAASYFWPSEHRPDIYLSGSFFHCPSARIPKAALGRYSPYAYPFDLFSLAMNSKLIEAPHIPTTKFGRIESRKPAQTVLYLDGLLDDEKPVYTTQAYSERGQPAVYATRFAGNRHGRSGNLSFGDGHVETMPGVKVVATNGLDIIPPERVIWYLEE